MSKKPHNEHPAVYFDNVSLTYPNGVESLRKVLLNIEVGEFVSLVGPSGCGKSTLLRLVSGLIQPSAGDIKILGEKPDPINRPHDVGFVFQTPTLLPWRTVLDNVALPLELIGMAKQRRHDQSRKVLERVGLVEFQNAYPRELSGGMKMRAALARALLAKPKLLLMDEPFGALDEITREKLGEELHAIWQSQGTTILFVTHNVYEAVFLSTRVIVMAKRPGTIIESIDIPFENRRTRSIRSEPQFAKLTSQISNLLAEASS